jgi:hypothetical protein
MGYLSRLGLLARGITAPDRGNSTAARALRLVGIGGKRGKLPILEDTLLPCSEITATGFTQAQTKPIQRPRPTTAIQMASEMPPASFAARGGVAGA